MYFADITECGTEFTFRAADVSPISLSSSASSCWSTSSSGDGLTAVTAYSASGSWQATQPIWWYSRRPFSMLPRFQNSIGTGLSPDALISANGCCNDDRKAVIASAAGSRSSVGNPVSISGIVVPGFDVIGDKRNDRTQSDFRRLPAPSSTGPRFASNSASSAAWQAVQLSSVINRRPAVTGSMSACRPNRSKPETKGTTETTSSANATVALIQTHRHASFCIVLAAALTARTLSTEMSVPPDHDPARSQILFHHE